MSASITDHIKNTSLGLRFWRGYSMIPLPPLAWSWGPAFRRAQELIRSLEFKDAATIEAFQLAQLQALVRHAFERCPFYRRLYSEAGIAPDDIQKLDDFRRLPVIDKSLIRKNFDGMQARGVMPQRKRLVSTSGSTGEPLSMYWHWPDTEAFERAFLWHYYGWRGVTPRSRAVELRAYVSPREKLFTYRRCNTMTVSCDAYGGRDIDKVTRAIRDHKPEVIFALPSNLWLVSKHMVNNGIKLDRPPSAVITSSEKLYPEQEEMARAAFGTDVMDLYGNTERTVHAIRCEQGRMHFVPLYGFSEISTALGRDAGEIISTGFGNRAMPFIRYRTGDYAEVSTNACSCGRSWPVIEKLLGKDADFLIRHDGTEVSVNMIWGLHMSFGAAIKEFQFIQDKPGLVELQYAADEALTIDQQRELLDKLQALRGISFTLTHVPAIKRGERNKYRMVLQSLQTSRSY